MKKEKIKFILLVAILCIVMIFVSINVYKTKEKVAACPTNLAYEIKTGKANVYTLNIDKNVKTKKERCFTLKVKLPVTIDKDKIIFYDTKQKEYSDEFEIKNQEEGVKIKSHYATIDQNKISLSMKVSVEESSKTNTYDLSDDIILKINNGEIEVSK